MQRYHLQGSVILFKKSFRYSLLVSIIVLIASSFVHVRYAKASDSPTRIMGLDRYATAVAISKKSYTMADTVIIASGSHFPDALSASPLAHKFHAPILLSRKDSLLQNVKDEITRLKASKAIIIGGINSISSNVENELIKMGLSVKRIGGKDRYETAELISKELPNTTAILASGLNFPDALSIAPYAAKNDIPILLTYNNQLSQSTKNALRDKTKTIVVGGTSVISEAIYAQLPSPTRYSGANRFETSKSIVSHLSMGNNMAYVASSEHFADALAGSVLAAKNNSPILLVKANEIPSSTFNLLKNYRNVTILGGDEAISQHVSTEIANDHYLVLGYYTKYSQSDNHSYNSLTQFHSYLNTISASTYEIDATGHITGISPTEGLALANQYNMSTYAAIQNHFNKDLTRQLLSSASLRHVAINNMIQLVKSKGYQGINIDFENMYAGDRPLFNEFIKELSANLKSNNLKLIISVPALTADHPTWNWMGAFQYSSLAQYANYIQLMTYDQHGIWGTPGPISGINWVNNVLSYATSVIPNNKIILGIPAYAYDWDTTDSTKNRATYSSSIPKMINDYHAQVSFDPLSQSPYLTYHDNTGDQHIVWFENRQSIQKKVDLVHQYHLAGISMWRMGYEDNTFWKAIQDELYK